MKEVKQNSGIILGIVILVALVIIIGLVTDEKSPNSKTGSIMDGQAYNSTTTDTFGAEIVGAFKVLKVGYGNLGSVVITTSTAGSFNLYDASTTVNGAVYGTTTLAKIGASAAAGTYTFDTTFTKGLVVEFQSTNLASSTITWR